MIRCPCFKIIWYLFYVVVHAREPHDGDKDPSMLLAAEAQNRKIAPAQGAYSLSKMSVVGRSGFKPNSLGFVQAWNPKWDLDPSFLHGP